MGKTTNNMMRVCLKMGDGPPMMKKKHELQGFFPHFQACETKRFYVFKE